MTLASCYGAQLHNLQGISTINIVPAADGCQRMMLWSQMREENLVNLYIYLLYVKDLQNPTDRAQGLINDEYVQHEHAGTVCLAVKVLLAAPNTSLL